MIQEILDETALPYPSDHPSRNYFDWLRHKIDPTVLIDCMTGQCYRRRDGARWHYPAYRVEKSKANGKWGAIHQQPATHDSEHFPPTATQSAA